MIRFLIFVALVTAFTSAGIVNAADRDPRQVAKFRATHPCPATGKTAGPCPGWVVDHAYPLCAGGADHPSNMQWQDTGQSFTKDRIERELCACKAGKP